MSSIPKHTFYFLLFSVRLVNTSYTEVICSFVTPPIVNCPSLSAPLSSPKVTTINFLIYYLITGHCLHQ